MSLRFIVVLCAIIVGVVSMTSCQPPAPRIAKAKEPVSMIATSNGTTTLTGLGVFNPVGKAD